jgi:hypothetical protein
MPTWFQDLALLGLLGAIILLFFLGRNRGKLAFAKHVAEARADAAAQAIAQTRAEMAAQFGVTVVAGNQYWPSLGSSHDVASALPQSVPGRAALPQASGVPELGGLGGPQRTQSA